MLWLLLVSLQTSVLRLRVLSIVVFILAYTSSSMFKRTTNVLNTDRHTYPYEVSKMTMLSIMTRFIGHIGVLLSQTVLGQITNDFRTGGQEQ